MRQKRTHKMSDYPALRDRFKNEEALKHLDAGEIGIELNIPAKTIRNWGCEMNRSIVPCKKARDLIRNQAMCLESDWIVDGTATQSLAAFGRRYGMNGGTVGRLFVANNIIPQEKQIAWNTQTSDRIYYPAMHGQPRELAQIPLPAEAELIAKHLKAWKRSRDLDDFVWPIIERKRWHESTHN